MDHVCIMCVYSMYESYIPEAAEGSLKVPTASAARLGEGVGEDWGRGPRGPWGLSRFLGIDFLSFFRMAFFDAFWVPTGSKLRIVGGFSMDLGSHLGTILTYFPILLRCFSGALILHAFLMNFQGSVGAQNHVLCCKYNTLELFRLLW